MLMKEYEAIRAIPTPALCEALQQNSALNRYNNIHLIDQSRVVLTDGFQPDYIHANWMDGYETKNSYILTQVSSFLFFSKKEMTSTFFRRQRNPR